MPRIDLLQFRSDTAENWTSVNPVLEANEPGYETDTGKMKVGDGETVWVDLEYSFENATPDLSNYYTKAEVDTEISEAVTGLYDDRGNYDASSNTFPDSGGSGTAGAILKGDIWTINVAGTLGGTSVIVGQTVRALVDTPGQTAGNWAVSVGSSEISFANQTESEAAALAAAASDASHTVAITARGLWWFWAKIKSLWGFNVLTWSPSVAVDLSSRIKKNFKTTATTTTSTFTFSNVVDGAEFDIKILFSGITSLEITLAGSGLTFKDSGITTTTAYYSGSDGDVVRLIGKVEGTEIDIVFGDGVVVNTISSSTVNIPSVGLLKAVTDLLFKVGGNDFGAPASVGLTSNHTLTILQNNTECASFTSTTARFRGLNLFGSSSGTSHSNMQSAGSFAKFIRSITGARTLDATDNIILANGTFTVTLPTAASIAGREYIIKNIGTGTITIATTSSQTIDGAAPTSLTTQWQTLRVFSDGSNWLTY